MEKIEVTARFNTEGQAFPIRFVWQAQTFLVESIGRRWEDAKSQHILVMAPGGRVFELVFVFSTRGWFMGEYAGPPAVV